MAGIHFSFENRCVLYGKIPQVSKAFTQTPNKLISRISKQNIKLFLALFDKNLFLRTAETHWPHFRFLGYNILGHLDMSILSLLSEECGLFLFGYDPSFAAILAYAFANNSATRNILVIGWPGLLACHFYHNIENRRF